ncbi:MAG: hypothetical protein QOK35_1387, partial [Pseudonocardiales bacterium]|nr:hypothetical protein [Pseudonocardiales bacterium]
MSLTNLCIWQLSQLDEGRPECVDGDEEPRSGGVVTLGGVPEGDDGVLVDVRTKAPSSGAEPADETSADGLEPDAAAVPESDVAAEAESDAAAVPESDAAALPESDAAAEAESDVAAEAEPDDVVSES